MPCDTCDRGDECLGIFEGIVLTLVCTACASTVVSDEGQPIVCFSKARALFPTTPPKRVQQLRSTPRRNPHYKNASPMRMYSLAELRVVQRNVEQEIAVRAELLKQKRHARLERMVRVHKISPASPIHSALYTHIFGDYLCATNPRKKLKELKYRFSAHDVAVRLCPLDPVCASNFLENRGITTFVSEDLSNLRNGFEYSLYLSTRVFRLEGLLIARFVCPSQLKTLEKGPLAEIPAAVHRLKKNAPRMLRMSLQSLRFENAEIDRMMVCSAMKTRLRRCVQYAHDPETVGQKMAEFWRTRNDRKHRRQILQGAMEKQGLEIRSDSVYCHDFVHGAIDVDLDEIVGIQYITRELFDCGGPRFWSSHHHDCESAFRQALLENGNTMDRSIQIALRRCTSSRRWMF